MSQHSSKDPKKGSSKELGSNTSMVEQEAKQLFVHGLLRYRFHKESREQREARIAAILETIRQPSASTPLPIWRRIIPIAAGLLAILFIGRFFLQSPNEKILEAEILSHTLENSRKGIHYFEGSFLGNRYGKTIWRKFEAFFGPNKAFAIRILRPGGSITFGSDGNKYWIKGRNGNAFLLPFLPKDGFPLLGMGANLSYLEVRPLMEAVLDPNSRPVVRTEVGSRIRFQGNFRFPAFFAGHPLRNLSGTKGKFDLWIQKETSMLQSLLLQSTTSPSKDDPPFRLRLIRKKTPPIDDSASIFSPKIAEIPSQLRFSLWSAGVLRRWKAFRDKHRQKK